MEFKTPQTFLDYLKSWGPGIAAVLAWAGAGDLVDCTAAGASYGFTLIWTMALALLLRGVIVSVMARYEICNPHRESIIVAYKRIHKWAPALIAAVLFIYCLIYGAFLLPAAGTGLWLLFGKSGGEWGRFLVCLFLMIIAIIIWGYRGRGLYKYIEILFKITLGVMMILFIGVAIISLTPHHVPEILMGLFTPRLPTGVGPWDAGFIAVSVIGAIGGSAANFLYPYFVRGKGWTREEYLKVQKFDLWLSIIVCVVLNTAIWSVAAGVLYPRGIHVTGVEDIALGLSLAVGVIGTLIVYAGFFITAFDTYVGVIGGQCMAMTDCILEVRPERKEKYKTFSNDPLYRYFIYICLGVAVIWALPGMPGVIYLILVGNALSVLVIPLLSVGLLIIGNKGEWIGDKYKNRWWHNFLLFVATAVALWSTYQLVLWFLR